MRVDNGARRIDAATQAPFIVCFQEPRFLTAFLTVCANCRIKKPMQINRLGAQETIEWNVPNLLRLAHFAHSVGRADILNGRTGPPFVRHAGLAPFSCYRCDIRPLVPNGRGNVCFTQPGQNDTKPRTSGPQLYGFVSMPNPGTQRDQAMRLLRNQGIVRLSEFREAGITAATISRMVDDGAVIRLARGALPTAGRAARRQSQSGGSSQTCSQGRGLPGLGASIP